MKKLMLGNAAVARGSMSRLRSDFQLSRTPSTEITEQAAQYDEIYCEWAPNEKVAMEVAFGAALAGKRSACVMKHVGSMWPLTRCLPLPIPGSTPAW